MIVKIIIMKTIKNVKYVNINVLLVKVLLTTVLHVLETEKTKNVFVQLEHMMMEKTHNVQNVTMFVIPV